MDEVLKNFWNSDYGQGLMKKEASKKVAYDQDSYYEGDKVGPTQDEIDVAHPGGGTHTECVNAGAPAEGAQYDLGGAGCGGDAHVETVKERAVVMDEVARKAPTGVQGSIKGLSKQAKKSTLAKLAQLADHLDQLELTEEANMIDEILQEEAGVSTEETSGTE